MRRACVPQQRLGTAPTALDDKPRILVADLFGITARPTRAARICHGIPVYIAKTILAGAVELRFVVSAAHPARIEPRAGQRSCPVDAAAIEATRVTRRGCQREAHSAGIEAAAHRECRGAVLTSSTVAWVALRDAVTALVLIAIAIWDSGAIFARRVREGIQWVQAGRARIGDVRPIWRATAVLARYVSGRIANIVADTATIESFRAVWNVGAIW